MTQSSLSEHATTVPIDKEPNGGDTATLVSRPPIVDYAILLKPRVMSLVLFTGFTGMLLAPGNIDVLTGTIAVICIALGAGASGAINMWYDRDIDQMMQRTKHRPLPAGRLKPRSALLLGTVLSLFSVAVMGIYVNLVSSLLLATTIAFYVFIYTIWLKRRSPYNIVIGGIAGATPPLIAWAAAASTTLSGSNPFDLGSPVPWMLFLLIFLWTPPHFWALALYRHGEYGKVGVPMMPDAKGPHRTLVESKIYCVLLILLAVIPIIWSGYGIGWPLSVVVAGLGIWYASTVWAIDADEALDENQRMPKAFHSFMASLKYLALMFIGVVIVAAQPWL